MYLHDQCLEVDVDQWRTLWKNKSLARSWRCGSFSGVKVASLVSNLNEKFYSVSRRWALTLFGRWARTLKKETLYQTVPTDWLSDFRIVFAEASCSLRQKLTYRLQINFYVFLFFVIAIRCYEFSKFEQNCSFLAMMSSIVVGESLNWHRSGCHCKWQCFFVHKIYRSTAMQERSWQVKVLM